ncbi:MAG TPA: ABC transporter ATP-binding protein [Polyangiales bacterium]|nr:ABC transporter ATP-binding protein [Polyangiales bacterium]
MAIAEIEIQKMVKEYGAGDNRVPVLRGVDVTIPRGEIVALMGPSGSGKSTLLNILGCLDRPTRGKYLLGGRDVSKLTRGEQAWVRLHYLGFIFQSFHLLGDSTVLENVSVPLFYAGVSREEREARAMKYIERVGLKERITHRPSELSGGQRQRVAIARALVNQPKVLLADEPTGALDTPTGIEVLNLLKELHQETGLTMVLVTHDQDVADVAHRTIYMRDGHVVDREVAHASHP